MPPGFFNNKAGLGIHFKPMGKWEESIRHFQGLKRNLKVASQNAQIRLCKEIAKRVKEHIRYQDLPWRHLTQEYADRKDEDGWDDRILMASQTYYDAIQVITKGSQHMIYVGVPRGIYGPKIGGNGRNKLEVAQIAAIHEYSMNAKRRRPLWNPTIREMGNTKGIKAKYMDYLYKELRRRGVPIDKIPGLLDGFK